MTVEYHVKGKKKNRVVSSRDSTYDGLHMPALAPIGPEPPEVRARIDALFHDRRS